MERRGNVHFIHGAEPMRQQFDGTGALNSQVEVPSFPRLSVVADAIDTPVNARVVNSDRKVISLVDRMRAKKRPTVVSDIINSPALPDRNVVSLTERRLAKERPSENAELEEWNDYFDTHYEEEGLPHDWFMLKSQMSNKRVGFIMDRQLSSLNPFDRASVLDTAIKVERDIAGFKLEFLSNHNVYPRMYHQNKQDLSRLEDPLYGESKIKEGAYSDIVEIISDEERNGSVKSAMQKVKEFLLSAPEGAMTIMTSPLGETGFKTDDGLSIKYPDSYFFIGVKGADGQVMNYTIKTNFSLNECRSVIARLTGTRLNEGASLEEYVDSVAMINPGVAGNIRSIFDVVNVLKDIHPESAFVDNQNGKVISWDDVRNDIIDGEKLYNFDKKSTTIIEKLRRFMRKAAYRTREEFKKGIASAILLLGDDFIKQEVEESLKVGIEMEPGKWVDPTVIPFRSYGMVLEATASRRGCSGGGEVSSFVMTAGGARGVITGESEGFTCPKCDYHTKRAIGDTCPGCGITKEEYAKEGNEVC